MKLMAEASTPRMLSSSSSSRGGGGVGGVGVQCLRSNLAQSHAAAALMAEHKFK